MNVTEPHCGTDLGQIRTRAAPNADGSYAITGTKSFISAGEHDLTDNSIHLVLAKTPDAPESSKGISLFIVPKFLVNDDGSPGERNAVTRSEEHTSELQSLMRISYAVFCLKKKKHHHHLLNQLTLYNTYHICLTITQLPHSISYNDLLSITLS